MGVPGLRVVGRRNETRLLTARREEKHVPLQNRRRHEAQHHPKRASLLFSVTHLCYHVVLGVRGERDCLEHEVPRLFAREPPPHETLVGRLSAAAARMAESVREAQYQSCVFSVKSKLLQMLLLTTGMHSVCASRLDQHFLQMLSNTWYVAVMATSAPDLK